MTNENSLDNHKPVASKASHPQNEIYQFSLLSALVSGVYSNTVGRRMSSLQSHGNFGLGTFLNLDGEMVMLDGVAYHITYDGTIKIVELDALLPFATLTHWPECPELSQNIGNGEQMDAPYSKKTIQEEIENNLACQSKNDFLAIKITGHFDHIQMRTAKAVTSEQSFRDVPSTQRVEKIQSPGIRGIMLGFRAPQWAQGVTVAGYHLHFIDEKKERGGHVLDYEIKSAKIEVEIIKGFKVDLPVSRDFDTAEIKFNLEDIFKVEGR